MKKLLLLFTLIAFCSYSEAQTVEVYNRTTFDLEVTVVQSSCNDNTEIGSVFTISPYTSVFVTANSGFNISEIKGYLDNCNSMQFYASPNPTSCLAQCYTPTFPAFGYFNSCGSNYQYSWRDCDQNGNSFFALFIP